MNPGKIHQLSLVLTFAAAAGCHPRFKDGPTLAATAAPGATAGTGSAIAPFSSPPLLPGTPDIAGLVEKVNPTVVNITTIHEIRQPSPGFNWPFDFFRGPMDPRGLPRQAPRGDNVIKQRALGSGFIVDGDGHVVTNAHVVENADHVRVRLADEREIDATVVGRDKKLDLAVLEMKDAKAVQAAALGSSEALRVGQYVMAIGNPFGLGHTVTMGIVSAKSRSIGAGPYDDFIQTDASINPGNSGGPLFNLKGEVIGINTAINPQGKGIGFAIPVDALKDALPQLLKTGHVARGKLGVLIQPVDEPMAKAMGLGRARGALVGDVEAGGAASRAGIKTGDVIIRVDDTDIPHSADLPRSIARHAPGSKVKVTVLREREERSFDVALDELKEEVSAEQSPAQPSNASPSPLGIALNDSQEGVVVQDVQSGGAADGELERGDIVLEVNKTAVKSAAEAANRIEKTPVGSPILFKVKRNGRTHFAAIERHAADR